MGSEWLRGSFIGQSIRQVCKPSWSKYPEEAVGWVERFNSQNTPCHDKKAVRVDWYSPDDEENPQNWSQAKKAFVAGVIGAYSFVVYMSAPIYTPGENAFIEEFHVNNAEASLGLAIYVYIEPASFSVYTE